MIRHLAAWIDELFGTTRFWVPPCFYINSWPQARLGKTGIAVARRKARKVRNRRRAKRV